MILLFFIFSVIPIIAFTGVFAYLTCELYIRFREYKKEKQEDIQPLLGVIYPKDEND
jgi:hypothetical protein